jgi:hypothetical protein
MIIFLLYSYFILILLFSYYFIIILLSSYYFIIILLSYDYMIISYYIVIFLLYSKDYSGRNDSVYLYILLIIIEDTLIYPIDDHHLIFSVLKFHLNII